MFFLLNQSRSATGDCANFIICNTDPLSRQPQTTLKNASELLSRKQRLQSSPDQQKQKPPIPPDLSKGAIYKLRLRLLFNQFLGQKNFLVLKPPNLRF
jgi:hypothetical protein